MYTDRVQHKNQTKQLSQLVQALISQCQVHLNLANKQQVSVMPFLSKSGINRF